MLAYLFGSWEASPKEKKLATTHMVVGVDKHISRMEAMKWKHKEDLEFKTVTGLYYTEYICIQGSRSYWTELTWVYIKWPKQEKPALVLHKLS